MTSGKKAEKFLAKELKRGIKNCEAKERTFPLDDAIRYTLSDEEQKQFDSQYDIPGISFEVETSDTDSVSIKCEYSSEGNVE